MKLFSLVLASLVAATAASPTTTSHHPVPWDQVEQTDKDATKFAFFAEARGSDLQLAQPTYHECTVEKQGGKDTAFKLLAGKSDLEFQPLLNDILGVNCIDCIEQDQDQLYIDLEVYIRCLLVGNNLVVGY